ncbi:hypothetical protein HK099_002147, partial [Clydaea vesicula]
KKQIRDTDKIADNLDVDFKDTIETEEICKVFCNNKITCEEHLKLNPAFIKFSKRISDVAVDILLKSGYTFEPFLDQDSLCLKCENVLLTDQKNTLSNAEEAEELKKILCKKFEKNSQEDFYWISKKWIIDMKKKSTKEIVSPFSTEYKTGVICEHQNLNTNKKNSRVLLEEKKFNKIKEILKIKKFEIEFKADTEECTICLSEEFIFEEKKREAVRDVSLEKNCLKRLLSKRNLIFEPDCNYFVIPIEFFESWKRHMKEPTIYEKPESIYLKGLMCEEHLGFIFDFNDMEYYDEKFYFVDENEWEELRIRYD